MPTAGSGDRDKSQVEENQKCSTYSFPDCQSVRVNVPSSGETSSGERGLTLSSSSLSTIKPVPIIKGHTRSASHGGGASMSTGVVGRPSALKQNRGHQRAFSQGQIENNENVPFPRGHSRVGSKTDFILPPGHRDSDSNSGAPASASKVLGHSRQASRSESIYTLRDREVPSLWHRFLSHVLRRKTKTEVEEPRYRVVVPNHLVPPRTPKRSHPNGKQPDNRIRTTKYTLLSFLPKNLLEQFHRVANLYFIFIVLLNWFPAINAFGKEVSMIPVLFVLGVTAIKDLFEDRRRHASDKRINNSTCRVYCGEAAGWRSVLWKNLRVGDLVHLSNNECVPADVLLLRSSDPHGLCHLDTCNLDGETNLKQRCVARGFLEKQGVFHPSLFKSVVEVDPPTTKIYRFHGAIVHPEGQRVPVGTDNLLLWECVVKNTDYVEGIVYAGHETKVMMNNGGPRYKHSSLERQMNLDVIWCVLILIVLCIIGAVGCKLWLSSYDASAIFIPQYQDPNYEGILSFWTFIIILQVMIPLSLYVTLEIAKLLQVYHINNDVDLFDPLTNKRIECLALNIPEELGQIKYVFSDKKKMIFLRYTIDKVDYNHPPPENADGSPDATAAVVSSVDVAVNVSGATGDANPKAIWSTLEPVKQKESGAPGETWMHLSESEVDAWSEPDRTVSLPRVGLSPLSDRHATSATTSASSDEELDKTASRTSHTGDPWVSNNTIESSAEKLAGAESSEIQKLQARIAELETRVCEKDSELLEQ